MPNCRWKGTCENFLDGIQSDSTYGLKPKLFNHWLQLYKSLEANISTHLKGEDSSPSATAIWIFCILTRNPFTIEALTKIQVPLTHTLCIEYAKNSDISRARERFFVGSRKIILYTERAYFYWRYKIRGIKNFIIYSLPERKEFYPQIMNMLEEGSHDLMSTALFSRFDLLQLERIVGYASAKRMITSEQNIFAFC